MAPGDWTRDEVEAVVADYFDMLAKELSGMRYSKADHRRRLRPRLNERSDASIEFKHANVSAALLDLGCQSIRGYKPRPHYQQLVAEVISEQLQNDAQLRAIAASDADRIIAIPEVEDIPGVLREPPRPSKPAERVEESTPRLPRVVDYIEREARNRQLGAAGEEFVLRYERARLVALGADRRAADIEHVSKTRGDGDGYDILSFEADGRERLIEVKTTKYSVDTPFFVSRNEVARSERDASLYHVYRLFDFRDSPGLFTLQGAVTRTCRLEASTFLARLR